MDTKEMDTKEILLNTEKILLTYIISDICNIILDYLIDDSIFQSASITEATTLTAEQSGTTFCVSKSSDYKISFPLAVEGLGYRFVLTESEAFEVVIAGVARSLCGIILGISTVTSISESSSIAFTATAQIGDNMTFIAVGGKWYVKAASSVVGGIIAP